MKPNETIWVRLDQRINLEQRKGIIESSNPASVCFAVEIAYPTNGADKVPLYFQVCTPDTGLARDFHFDLTLYSMQTGQVVFQETTSRGSMASRKVLAHVSPTETWVLRVSKPKTGFFARWLLGKPRLWFFVGAHKLSRQFDVAY